MSDLHDLAAAYAMNALDASERAAFEAHLHGCEDCATELAALQPAATALGEDAAVTPPPAMRASVLEAIAGTPQERTAEQGESALRQRRFAFPRWVTGAAVAAALVVLLAVSGVVGGGVSREDVWAAHDRATVELRGEVGSAQFTYSDSLDTGYFVASVIRDVADGETYQLWLIDDEGPTSAGTFVPAADNTVEFKVEGEIAPGKTLGLTIEPEGGSPAPTGDVLLAEVLVEPSLGNEL